MFPRLDVRNEDVPMMENLVDYLRVHIVECVAIDDEDLGIASVVDFERRGLPMGANVVEVGR